MKRIFESDWDRLATRFGPEAVARYRPRLRLSEPFWEPAPRDEAARLLLAGLVAEGHLEFGTQPVCPQCSQRVTDRDLSEKSHPCGFSFEHDQPELLKVYSRRGLRSRDPLWVVTVHGMNTRGEWQQEFGWKLAQLYGYAVPVDIYKYGLLLLSPLLLPRQEHYAELLVARLRKRRREMAARGFGDRPDVISHSFGTWLLARALKLDPELRLGRVVLTGSVIPPDFDWSTFLGGTEPRVEAVLCHCGGRDGVVPLAQYLVPRSGPSGQYGFNPQEGTEGRLVHRFESDFKHSDYFVEANLDRLMNEDWSEFLTATAEDLAHWKDPAARRTKAWQASPWRYLTRPLKYILLLSLLLTGVGLVGVLIFGAIALW